MITDVITDNTTDTSLKSVLPWQMVQWSRMMSHVSSNTLPHAFLFSGVEGIGKALFAKYLSSFLLCTEIINRHDDAAKPSGPCGLCKQCKLFSSDTHPDFKIIEPESNSASIKVDQIRQLVDFFSQSSQQGGYKIAVLAPAEALNHNAANALLKTLEEPSGNAIIILITHQPGTLLPTIRSRCQVVDFSLPTFKQSLAWLSNYKGELPDGSILTDQDLTETLQLAGFSPLKAINYVETGALTEHRQMLDELGALLKNDVLSTTLATRWNDDFALLRLSWMISWLEQIIKLKFGSELVISAQAEKMFSYLSTKASHTELFTLYANCLKQYKLFLGTSNPNKILSFEALLHMWSSLMRKA